MLAKIFGELSWKRPQWVRKITVPAKQVYQRNFRRNNIIALSAILVIVIGTAFWALYKPAKIQEAYAAVSAPVLTPIANLTKDNANKPQDISVNFYNAPTIEQPAGLGNLGVNIPTFSQLAQGHTFYTSNSPSSIPGGLISVAPLNQINHIVEQGIQIEPEVAGAWRWSGDSSLTFTPKTQWQADTTYTISMTKTLITPHIRLKTPKISFTMPAFTATISKATFNLNLKDPTKKNIVATIDFNYPVQRDSVASHVQLTWADGQNIPVQIHFDQFSRQAYVQSAQVDIGKQAKFVTLTILKGIVTTQGDKLTKTATTTSIPVPSLESYFKIENIHTSYVTDAKGNSQQILTISSNIGVTAAELADNLQVYLLTEADSKKLTDNNLQDKPQAVTETMLKQAELLKLTATPTEFNFSPQHSYIIHAPENRLLLVSIKSGMQAQGGFLLAQTNKQLVATSTPPRTISFVHQGSLMALTGQQKLQVVARGLPAVKITVYKVLPQDLNQLISQTYGNLQDPKFNNPYNFNEENIAQRFSEIKTFSDNLQTDLQRPNNFSINLSDFQTPDNHLGLYLLQIQGYDPATKQLLSIKNSRLVALTNLGIIVKTNADNTQDVFVQSIVTGEPVANAQVTLIGKNGVAIMHGTTDSEGHAHFFAFTNDTNNEPLAYVVSKGNEESFIPFNRADRIINLSRFDIGGTYLNSQQQNQLNAYIFTDSGLYRPGTEVHFGMILKSADFASHPDQLNAIKALPLLFTITDSNGKVINQQNLNSNETGFLTTDWQSSIGANSGTYFVSLYLGNKVDPNNLIGSADFRVEAFMPATMKLNAAFNQQSKQGWVSSDNLQAVIHMENLYGLPANHNQITGEIDLTPGAFYFAKYPDYQFLDPLVTDKKDLRTVTEKLTPEYTDAAGQAKLDLDLKKYADASYSLSLYIKGHQQDGSVAAEAAASIMVSPLSYIVGYKTASNLDFLRENSKNTINFIALDPQAKSIALPNLTADLYVLQQVSVLVEQADGTYAYQTKTKATLIKEMPYAIAANGSDFVLPTDKAGNYQLVIANAKSEKLSSVNYTVVGNAGYSIAQQANLSLKLDKAVYLAGSDIKLALYTPYPGAGLITVEKNKVVAFKWFQSKGGNTTETIQIPADFHGTGYVEVNYARAATAKEIFMNPFSFAVAPFSIDNTAQTIAVHLQAPAISLPGEELPITYSVNKSSKILVFAVDKGVLDVANYKTPDPLNYFFSKQALQVTTAQTLDLILPRFQENTLSTTGGDSGNLNKYIINPFQQNLRMPVLYWSKILEASDKPQTVYYKVPDYFNGDLQIMAVAVNNNAVGSAEKQSYIQAHFIISPNVPNYVTPGDSFTATVLVTNNVKGKNTSDPLTVQLEKNSDFTMSGANMNGIGTFKAEIQPGKSQTFRFVLQTQANLGTTELKFIVSNGHESSTLTQPITVQPATLYNVKLQNGFSKTAVITLPTNTDYYAAYRDLRISAANQASIFIPGLIEKIQGAPLYNIKQFDVQLLSEISRIPRNSVEGEVLQQKLNDYYNELPNLQNTDGSFSGINFLPQPIDNSLLIMHFLTIAKRQGYQFPKDIFNAGLQYLQTYAYQNQVDDAVAQAQAILILTQNEELTTNAIDHLQTYLKQTQPKTWQSNLAVLNLAASYYLLQQQNYAEKLAHDYVNSQKELNANELNADAIFLLGRYFPSIAQSVISTKAMQFLIQSFNQDQTDTKASIESIFALQAYTKLLPLIGNDQFQIEADINNQWKTLAKGSAINNLQFPVDTSQVRITHTGNDGYFYQVITAGYPNKLPVKAIADNLQVDVDVQDAKGNSVTTVKLGEVVTVHLRFRSITPDSNFTANIINLLPAGFQLIKNSLSDYQYNQVNVRDDRLIFKVNVNNMASDISYQLRANTTGRFVFPSVIAKSSQFGVTANSVSLAKEMTVQ